MTWVDFFLILAGGVLLYFAVAAFFTLLGLGWLVCIVAAASGHETLALAVGAAWVVAVVFAIWQWWTR